MSNKSTGQARKKQKVSEVQNEEQKVSEEQNEEQKVSEVQNEKVVSLQIGESRFQVRGVTFNKLINKEGFTVIEGDTYYADRDGDIFKYILKYLRSDIISFPNDFNDGELLKKEAEFYGLSELMAHLQKGAGKPEKVTLKIMIPEENHFIYNKPGIDILLNWTTSHVDWETLVKGFKDTLEFEILECSIDPSKGPIWANIANKKNPTFLEEIQSKKESQFRFHVQDEGVPRTFISGFLTSGFSLVTDKSSTNVPISEKSCKSVRELVFQRIKPVN